jgi:hypothetical protein
MKWSGTDLTVIRRAAISRPVSNSRTSHAPHSARAILALSLGLSSAIFALSGCNDYGNTFQSPTGAPVNFVAPSDATAGTAGFTITVTSSQQGFVAQTVVQWNGKTIPTTYVSAATVTATVAATLIAKPGTAFINTLNPFSGAGNNGLSNTVSFLINPVANPVPAVTSLSPTAASAGAASFTLTVNGSSFLPTSDPSGGSQVRWNLGASQFTLPVVNISSTQIQATVDSSLLVNSTAAPETAIVTVYNPPAPGTTPINGGVGSPNAGGGGTSPGGLSFTVNPAGTSSTAAPRSTVAEETPAVSLDGRYVAYTAMPGEHAQIILRDTCEGADSGCQPRSQLLSAASDGTAGNDDSRNPSMSSDGRYVAFSSAATNLASASANTGASALVASAATTTAGAPRQIYLRDTCVGAAAAPSCTPSTQLVSTDPAGALIGTEGILPSISASGRFIAFLAVMPSHANSTAAKSAAQVKSAAGSSGSSNSGYRQVFIRDTCIGATSCTPKTTRISIQPGETSPSDAKPAGPALSGSSARVAVSDPPAAAATIFTRSVAIDDRVFVALTGSHP